MNSRLMVLCLAAMLTLFGALRLSRQSTAAPLRGSSLFLPYQGRFVDDPSYRELAGALPRMLERAQRKAAGVFGVSADRTRIRLRLVDDSLKVSWTEQFVARTLVGSYGPAAIELRLEPLLARRIDVEATLTHEAAHAVLAGALGPGYVGIPEWLREGLAVDVAGETELSLSRAISLTRARPVELIADGLSRTTHTAADYGESGLAIQTLRQLAGEDVVPRLVACLAGDGEWPPCLRRLTGLEPAQFESRAMIDALDTIGDLAADRVARYESARDRLDAGDPAGALAELENLLDSGMGPFDREARLDSARALELMNRSPEALEQTEELLYLGEYPPQMGIEALALEARVSRRAGLDARVEEVCRKLRLYYARDGGGSRDECAHVRRSRISVEGPRGASRAGGS